MLFDNLQAFLVFIFGKIIFWFAFDVHYEKNFYITKVKYFFKHFPGVSLCTVVLFYLNPLRPRLIPREKLISTLGHCISYQKIKKRVSDGNQQRFFIKYKNRDCVVCWRITINSYSINNSYW